MDTLVTLNSNHLDNCVCFGCRPPHRGRYTKEEWRKIHDLDKPCKHCKEYPGAHAGDHWMAGDVMPAGACHVRDLKANGIRSNAFTKGGGGVSDVAAQRHSSEYVYEPKL